MTGRTPFAGKGDHRPEAQNVGWSVLPGWSGPPELLARIAEAGIEALQESEGHEPQCTIEVVIPVTGVPESGFRLPGDDRPVNSDIERFDSPKTFNEDVTVDALRRFTAINIRIVGNDLRVDVEIVRERGLSLRRILSTLLGRRPTEGMFLYVVSTDPERAVRDVRDHVLAAMQRGHSKWRHAGSSSGLRDPFITQSGWTRAEDPRFALATKTAVGSLILIVLAERYNLSPVHGTYLQFAVAVAVGGIISVIAFLILPVVEVSSATRIGQFGHAALRITLLVSGPVIGLLLKQFVEPLL